MAKRQKFISCTPCRINYVAAPSSPPLPLFAIWWHSKINESDAAAKDAEASVKQKTKDS